MLKKNVEGLEKMAADYLQYRYGMYLHADKASEGKAQPDWTHYNGACDMLAAFGCEWRRHYTGPDTEEGYSNINNYSHWVRFPSDDRCKRLNFDAWAE